MAIKFKGSETSGAVPTGLGERELAWNLSDKIIYSANSSGNLISFSGKDENAVWGNINGILSNQSDLQTALNGKENYLNNPSTDGLILSSSASGVRSWISQNVNIKIINTENFTVFNDTRNKELSTNINHIIFTDSSVSKNQWISFGNGSNGNFGYIVPYNATIIGITIYTIDANGHAVPFNLFVGGTSVYNNTLVGNSGEETIIVNNLNININQGDKLRIKSGDFSGFLASIDNTMIEIRLRYRI